MNTRELAGNMVLFQIKQRPKEIIECSTRILYLIPFVSHKVNRIQQKNTPAFFFEGSTLRILTLIASSLTLLRESR